MIFTSGQNGSEPCSYRVRPFYLHKYHLVEGPKSLGKLLDIGTGASKFFEK